MLCLTISRRHLPLFFPVCLAFAPAAFGQDAALFRIDAFSVVPSGQLRLHFPASTNSYYILYRSSSLPQIGTPIRMALGTEGGTLEDQRPGDAAAFYRVRRVPLAQPLDSDADGIDDVYELQHPDSFNPLDSSDTSGNFISDQHGNFVKYEPFSNTQILSPADLSGLLDASDDGKLTFAPSSPAATSLKVGQVIVAGSSPAAPEGLLRVVLAVDADADGNRVVSTALAPLQLAFRKLHVHSAGEVNPFAPAATFRLANSAHDARLRSQAVQPFGEVNESKSFEIVVFDGDGNPSTTQDQVKIDATLSGGFAFDLAIDVDWGAILDLPSAVTDCLKSLGNILEGEPPSCSMEDLLPEVKLIFTVDPKLAANVGVSGAAVLEFEKEFEVGAVDLPPIPIGFLVFLPSVDVLATVSGKASAGFSVGAHASVELESKAILSSKRENSGLLPISIKDADAGADDAKVDLYAEATAKVGARLNLSLYGIVGPYATASAVAQISANPLGDPCWSLNLGVEGNLGVRVTSPRLPLLGYVTLLDWQAPPFKPLDQVVASGSCSTTPEGANPPGGGPTAKQLQSPSFTPWASVLGGPIDGSNAGDVTSFVAAFPFLTPSIDGRYLAGGGGARGLLKIDDHPPGSITWTGRLVPNVPFSRPLKSLASVPTTDAGLLTLYLPEDSAAFILARQTQAGAYDLVRAYRLPDDCVPVPALLINDAGTGYLVAGSCRSSGQAWLAHLDANLHLIRVRMLRDADANTIHLAPSVAVRVGAEILLAGDRAIANQPPGENSQLFILRLDDQENPRAGVAYTCPDRSGLFPTAGAPSSDGAVTLVGDATGTSFIARVRKDDSLGFMAFPQLGDGVRDWFVPSSVAELPTSGLIVAYNSGVLAGDPPVVGLLGLDGAGRSLWANSYTLAIDGAVRPFAWPALRITDDGGILVAATAGPLPPATEGGTLVAMKVFAKNGYLGPNNSITSSALAPNDRTYPVNTQTFTPVITASTGSEEPFDFTP